MMGKRTGGWIFISIWMRDSFASRIRIRYCIKGVAVVHCPLSVVGLSQQLTTDRGPSTNSRTRPSGLLSVVNKKRVASVRSNANVGNQRTIMNLKYALTSLVLAASFLGVRAADTPKVGDQAPAFTAQDQDGKTVKLSDFAGKQAVLVYFYPKDQTPGCTKEACGFRDRMEDLKKQD